MQQCWRFKPKQRPTFVQIVEMLVPDLDPRFRDVAFFFSDANMDDGTGDPNLDLADGSFEAGDPPRYSSYPPEGSMYLHDGEHPDKGDFYRVNELHSSHADDLRTPLTGTPSRHSLSLSDIDAGTPYRSRASLSDNVPRSVSKGDTLSIEMEPTDQTMARTSPHLKGGEGDASERTPLRGSTVQESSFNEPPPLYASPATGQKNTNEGSKESSKSSGSSSLLHMNGLTNGHIPRANAVPQQGQTHC